MLRLETPQSMTLSYRTEHSLDTCNSFTQLKLIEENELTNQSVEPAVGTTTQQDGRKNGELPKHLKDISMVGLTEEQKEIATALLVEEQCSFAKDDSDIGSIKDVKLDIRLKDETLVQKN